MSSDQPDLFALSAAPAKRHMTTPINYQGTSGQAWASIREYRGTKKEILLAIYKHGALTDEQLEHITQKKHQTVSADRSHLAHDEPNLLMNLEENGEKRPKIRWALTPMGRKYVEHFFLGKAA